MLLSSFYEIKKQEVHEQVLHTVLVFKEDHVVYDGHFPQNPITPGVCLLQTAKQLLEETYLLSLRIDTILNIKFLKLVIPDDTKEVHFVIQFLPNEEEGKKTVSVIIRNQEQEVYTKAKIVYTIP